MKVATTVTLLTIALEAAVPNPRQFTARYLDLGGLQSRARLLAADSSGNLFVVSGPNDASTNSGIRISKTDGSGKVLATFDFGGSSIDEALAVAIDPQGNVLVGGYTISSDFPLVAPLQTSGTGFLTKVDAQLQRILYSTRIAGDTRIMAATFDSAGNVYVAGTSDGTTVTPGAFQTQAPTPSVPQAVLINGFVAEISAAGDKLVFSTYYSGGGVICIGGCGGFQIPSGPSITSITTEPTAIALDSSGAVVIAGFSDANNLPVSANAYAPQCGCDAAHYAGFVAKLAPAGTQLIWGSYIPYMQTPPFPSGIMPQSIALDSAGNVLLSGAAPQGFPTTAGVVQPGFPPATGPLAQRPLAGFVAKLDAGGTKLLFSTFFGGNKLGSAYNASTPSGVAGMAVDGQGTIWLSGGSAFAALPPGQSAAPLGQNYLAALSPDASTVQSLFLSPDGSADGPLAILPPGTISVLGSVGALLIATSASGPSLLGITETAGTHITPVVTPRDLVSLYGIGIGPAVALPAQITNGIISDSLGGVQVLFDGAAAALLYAGPSQINAIVPSSVAGRRTTVVEIVTPSGRLVGPTLSVQRTSPEIMKDVSGQATATNQDGTVNSGANPAPFGSTVSIWITGVGVSATAPDHRVNPEGFLTDPLFPVSVLSTADSQRGGAWLSLEVLYAGDAPLMPNGLTQVNFRLPPKAPPTGNGSPAFQVQVGDSISDIFALYLE